MPQPAIGVYIETEGVATPGKPVLVDPGPSPAMASIPNFGVVSAEVNDNGYWKAWVVRAAGKDVATEPVDLMCHVGSYDTVVVELLQDAGPGNHMTLVFEALAGGGPTREMVANLLSTVLDIKGMSLWWGTPHPSLGSSKPGEMMDKSPDAVMVAARETVRQMRVSSA
jgi:hypothetical protein